MHQCDHVYGTRVPDYCQSVGKMEVTRSMGVTGWSESCRLLARPPRSKERSQRRFCLTMRIDGGRRRNNFCAQDSSSSFDQCASSGERTRGVLG